MFTKANPARLKARSVERINFAVVAVTATLFLAIAVFVAFSTSKMMENEARSTVENVVKATVGRIDRQMASVESAVENSAWIVEERISDPDYMFRITGELVQNNPFIVGSTVAFEPNFFPSKQLCAHRKKLSPMARVFPDRTAPSQTMASRPANSFPGTHQVSTVFCFGENFRKLIPRRRPSAPG